MAMLGRGVASILKISRASQFSSSAKGAKDEGKGRRLGRKLVGVGLLGVTGIFAVSALDDLVIFYRCSNKAIEKACKDQRLIEAIGEPIERGPWYGASLATGHQRRSVSCTFPVSGSRGSGIFSLKAIRNDDDNSWRSYFLPGDWEVLMMEALLHAPGNDKEKQTFRISISDPLSPTDAPPSKSNEKSVSPQSTSSSEDNIST